MKLNKCLTYVLLCVLYFQCGCSEDIPRVGIVGAGIGGTSAAYFLRELFGDNVEIDIFEKQHVGGRLAPITISGHNYNAGGTIIHPDNMYMKLFTEKLGLERDEHAEEGRLGLFNGEEVVFATSQYTAVTLGKLFWRYGLDVYNIKTWVREKLLKHMDRLYELQKDGHAFSTVEDLLTAMDPSLVDFSHKSIRNLLKEEGFSDKFIDEFVMGAMRVNYGQTHSIHGLVGAVSLAGVERGLWNVVGGNHKVPQGLLKKAKANLIRGEVQAVSLVSDGTPPLYQLDYMPMKSTNLEDLKSKEYDIVIIATPFYKGQTHNINFEDFTNNIKPVDYEFHTTIATFMEGNVNASYFGYNTPDEVPNTFMTTKGDLFINSFSKQKPVTGEKTEKPVWRIFSNRVPNMDELKQLVPDHTDLRVVDWKAYPEYPESVEMPSFTLHDQVYHINAIEMASGAMEMSCVAAKNVALLSFYRYTGQYDKIDEILSQAGSGEKTEL